MARTQRTDHLQAYTFWLADIGPTGLLSLPLFTPSLGFQSISSPELQLDVEEIVEGNWPIKRKVLSGHGSVSAITLTRGLSLGDSDFFRWIQAAMYGDRYLLNEGALGMGFAGGGGNIPRPPMSVGGPTVRRQLMLLQFFPHLRLGIAGRGSDGLGAVVNTAALFAQLAALGGAETLASFALSTGLGIGPVETLARIPARAWMLSGCIPTRYKAASDFDANSSDVSVAELEFEYEGFDEIDLAG